MITYNEGDPDDYNTKPSHPSDQEEEEPWPENNYNYKYDAQFSEILEEFSDTELGQEEDFEKSEEKKFTQN